MGLKASWSKIFDALDSGKIKKYIKWNPRIPLRGSFVGIDKLKMLKPIIAPAPKINDAISKMPDGQAKDKMQQIVNKTTSAGPQQQYDNREYIIDTSHLKPGEVGARRINNPNYNPSPEFLNLEKEKIINPFERDKRLAAERTAHPEWFKK